MRSIPGNWRWRPNPLRRRSDLVEAWAGLAAVAITVVGAPAAGIAAGRAVDTTLRHAAATQRAQRHEVRAVVLPAARPRSGTIAPQSSDGQATSHTARISWKGSDGKPHQALVTIVGRHTAGTTLPVWIDRDERPVDPPLDTATATSNAVAAGVGAAAALAALVMAARNLLGWRLLRRRLADWERAWSRIGQDWGRAGAGG
ncbi:hypothetical protein POF50_022500 [Streptomyces sp. SL13]|uniref:Uncharacterized protein n=1 Tax=Streptantibioticus silvisoli TaxID=2705255 RepID=A0AA90KA79_9ACTN|nr:hypothetical protein [Streptantibioticus silvisoli]MDI5972073.1 hypothetical protein [Streptantibioticus silvisoli]